MYFCELTVSIYARRINARRINTGSTFPAAGLSLCLQHTVLVTVALKSLYLQRMSRHDPISCFSCSAFSSQAFFPYTLNESDLINFPKITRELLGSALNLHQLGKTDILLNI